MSDKKIKVLIADDEADFRKLMTFWLQSKNYDVIEAANGQLAIKAVQEQNPDIVFMDLRMPVIDGAEAVTQIRQFNQDIPIIIISSFVEDPKVREMMSFGISGVFYKGGNFQDGLNLIETALRMHKKLKK